jgi:guanylate kinase
MTFTFNRPTLITLTAPTCSGKSWLLNEITSRGHLSRIVSTTTRAQRDGEINGFDYDFITEARSREIELEGNFFELIEFNGTRYGVTHDQMRRAMDCDKPPAIVLEPQGLEIYRQKCWEMGWDVFQVYVNTVEDERVRRLNARTTNDITVAVGKLAGSNTDLFAYAFAAVNTEKLTAALPKIVDAHTSRLLSITGDERRWQGKFSWDAIVPGDDVEQAIEMISQGIAWRNRKTAPPVAIGAVTLPL